MKSGWTEKILTGTGTWTCPAGVTEIFVFGCGSGTGGNGGTAGGTNGGTVGGTATWPALVPLTVVPNTSYSYSVANSSPGASGTSYATNGNNTFFSTLQFFGARSLTYMSGTTANLAGFGVGYASNNFITSSIFAIKYGIGTSSSFVLYPSPTNISGINGTDATTRKGGKAGASGYFQRGGTGGNSNDSGPGTEGGIPFNTSSLSSLSGGAGGGAGGVGSVIGSRNGGPSTQGFLKIMWVE